MHRAALMACLVMVVAATAETTGQEKDRKGLTYVQDVDPIIQKYCLPCHAAANENPSGLALDDFTYLMKGGNHGDAVIPGKAEKSYLYLKLLPDPPFGKQMARNRKRLTKEELQTIYDWIAQGARKE